MRQRQPLLPLQHEHQPAALDRLQRAPHDMASAPWQSIFRKPTSASPSETSGTARTAAIAVPPCTNISLPEFDSLPKTSYRSGPPSIVTS
jgi:hypothetical protein